MSEQPVLLWLASWYPNRLDAYTGDFTQRHARALALLRPVHVLHIYKDETGQLTRDVLIETTTEHNLTETIIYYHIPPSRWALLNKWRARKQYLTSGRQWINTFCKSQQGRPIWVHVDVAMRAGLLARWMQKKWGYPYVVMEHWTGYYPEHQQATAYHPPLFWQQVQKIIQGAAGLMADSRALGSLLHEKYGIQPFFEIPNVVDTDLFEPPKNAIASYDFTYLHASTMGHQKNTDGIIRAFVKCREKNSKLRLLLLGPTDALESYGYTPGFFQENNIVVTGNLTHQDVAQHMQQANAFVLFSRYENLPCVILEARCCGLPIIATDVGGIKYHLNPEVDILIPSEDEAALEAAMMQVQALAKDYNKQDIAREARDTYNPIATAERFISAYSNIFEKTHK